MEKCQEQGLPEPDFEEDHGVFVVRFYQDKWNEENLKKLGIKERQIKAVMYVKEKGKITNKEYQEINNCSRNTATNDLRRLVESHILKESGVKGAGSYYKIA
jgi:ATP-dependent DNA helicase RecG